MTDETKRGPGANAADGWEVDASVTKADEGAETDDPWGDAFDDPPSGAESALGEGQDAEVMSRQKVPGLEEYLGRGYDLLQGDANPKAVKRPIFDLEQDDWVAQPTVDKSIMLDANQMSQAFTALPAETKLVYRRPSKIGYVDLFEATTHVSDVDTDTTKTFDWGVGGDISGSYMGFSAKVQARFDSRLTRMATSRVMNAVAQIVYWKLDYMKGYGLSDPPPFDAAAKKDFETREVDELLDYYGSHVIRSFGIGSRIVHHYIADTSKLKKGMDLKASLSASYEGAGSASLNVDGNLKQALEENRSSIQIEIEAIGISDEQAGEVEQIQSNATHPLAILKQGWHNPSLIAFFEESLLPIWEIEGLMSDDKQAKFKAAFERKAGEKQDRMRSLYAGLQPLYLFRKGDGAKAHYRFARHVSGPSGNTGEWVLNPGYDSGGGKNAPWLLISARPKDGLVPLYEYALDGKPDAYRYETETFMDAMNAHFKTTWKKTSSIPLGYVGPPVRDASADVQGCPVYGYFDSKDVVSRGVLYSAMKAMVWDGDSWKRGSDLTQYDQDLRQMAQEEHDKWWNSMTGWEQFWGYGGKKPPLGNVYFGLNANDPTGWLFSNELAHWYAEDSLTGA